MWESIRYRMIGTGNTTMGKSYQVRLRRVELGYPGYQYWLYSRAAGKEGELVRVPSAHCEEIWEAAQGLVLDFPADASMVIGGGYSHELEFDSCDNYCKFRWKNDIPEQWHGPARSSG